MKRIACSIGGLGQDFHLECSILVIQENNHEDQLEHHRRFLSWVSLGHPLHEGM